VFVQLVIAAITTWPWSSSVSVPLSSVSETAVSLRSAVTMPTWSWPLCELGGVLASSPAGGSLAGNDPADGSSSESSSFGGTPDLRSESVSPSSMSSPRSSASASRNAACASDSETRSCGRFGPASDGSTVDRSSSSVSE
jgi:hypothetical protein